MAQHMDDLTQRAFVPPAEDADAARKQGETLVGVVFGKGGLRWVERRPT